MKKKNAKKGKPFPSHGPDKKPKESMYGKMGNSGNKKPC